MTAVHGTPARASSARRLLALSRLLSAELGTGGAARAGRVYPWIVCVVVSGLALAARGAERLPAPDAIVAGALAPMSWAALLVAGAIAGRAKDRDTLAWIGALAAARGVPAGRFRVAVVLGGMRTVFRAVLLPSLVLSLVVMACAGLRGSGWLWSARLLLSVAAYAALFGAVFGGVAALLRLVLPRRGRFVFGVAVTVLVVVRAAADDLGGGPLGWAPLVSRAALDAPQNLSPVAWGGLRCHARPNRC